MARAREVILDFVRDLDHEKIEAFIDLGCDDGTLTALVAREAEAEEVYGVDISGEALESASSKRIKTFQGDLNAYELPFKDNYFDLVLSSAVLECLICPDHMLREVYRVLKPGRHLILHTFHVLGSWTNRFSLLLGYQPYGCHVSIERPFAGTFHSGKLASAFPEQNVGYAFRAFTLRAVKKLLEYHGLSVIRVKGARGVFPKSKIFGIVDTIFSKRASWARRVVTLARKPAAE